MFRRFQLLVLISKFEKTSCGPAALKTKKIHFLFGETKQVKFLSVYEEARLILCDHVCFGLFVAGSMQSWSVDLFLCRKAAAN